MSIYIDIYVCMYLYIYKYTYTGDQNIKEKNATLVEISKITSKEW
jgi:hypothetical protein